nr:hypothetical protein [Pseudopedobacter sp.]
MNKKHLITTLFLTKLWIKKFKLTDFIDFFISSSFVNLRKPDTDIFSFYWDFAQAKPKEIIYIANQPLFVKISEGIGMKGISHTDYNSTVAKLQALNLTIMPSVHG